jgi:putative SOS response-associated peptidase YedK
VCGRYTFTPGNLALFAERFGVGEASTPAAGYNIAPGRPVATIAADQNGEHTCKLMHWGLIPDWAPRAERQYKMINARVETVAEKRAYRDLLDSGRCLIPADGFYEWQKTEDGPKQPYWFHHEGTELFSFPGLWTSAKPSPGGDVIVSCTILTTAANEVVSPVHHRMPVILDRSRESTWLDPSVDGEAALAALSLNANDALLRRAVSRAVSSTSNQGANCIEPDDLAPQGSPSERLF